MHSMIIGIGIDLVDQQRIRAGLEKYGAKYTAKLFTSEEVAYCERHHNKVEHFAGKFAVKEAYMKALGTGATQDVHFSDIEVLNHENGMPYIAAHNTALGMANSLGVTQIHVTITHTANLAAAVVVLEGA